VASLSACDLTKVFRKGGQSIKALDDVSIEIGEGEAVGLVGANGAGKTTLNKIFCGLVKPTAGRVSVDGFDVETRRAEALRRLGVVFSEVRGFYWRLSIRDNLMFYARLWQVNESRERVAKVAEEVGLSERDMDARFQLNSSGLMRRVALARALLHDPSVLLLDEPTISLDVVSHRGVVDLIGTLNSVQNKTLLLSTHDIEEVERLCSRVVVLDKGRIIMAASPSELRKATSSSSLELRVKRGFQLDGMERLPHVMGVQMTQLADEEMKVTITIANGADLQALLSSIASGGRILELRTRESSLEEALLKLMEASH
jgi:ABC-2 type transport system ATP-binding protein